jgi:hypothetical protein
MPADKDKMKKKQVAQNDGRCDLAKYPNRANLPKDCLEKSGTGAAAVSSTQGQSGGDSSGAAGAGASSSSSSSSGGASK